MSSYVIDKMFKDISMLQNYLIKLGFYITYITAVENTHIFTQSPLSVEEEESLRQAVDDYDDIEATTFEHKYISQLNSTLQPLESNGVFTGVFEDISEYSTLTVSCVSNCTSQTNGLELHFSADGITSHDIKKYTILSSVVFVEIHTITFAYFKIVYKNSQLAQNSFALQTIAHLYKNKDITDTTQINEVKIKEEFLQPGQVPTNGYFRAHGFQISCPPNETSYHNFSWPYPISPTVLKFYVKEDNIGDVINTFIARDFTCGTLTATANSDATTLNVSSTVIKHIKPGFLCKITDGQNTDDLGEVVFVNRNDFTITLSTATTNSFAPNSLIKMTVNNIKDFYFFETGLNVVGDSRIGSSYLPPSIVVTLAYTNTSEDTKTFNWITEFMY